ncbi:hypothetical protein SLS53_006697 [Cytospora paraplurivora]|uniref:Glucose-methanol-choline oxidoreductase N-terminal domain-containing protein n=1 Tax=Cytospora paraplurivora TaxID=2898453 RepID=A0AAN9U373_9PEZI
MNPSDKRTKTYQGHTSDYLAGRVPSIQTSRILGGGSSVNMLMYSRPQRSELDAWNTPGWSADEVLKYMNKFESYHGPGPEDRHGHDGPLYIGPARYRGKVLESDFIEAVEQQGWPEIKDNNDLDTTNGSVRALKYINPDGKRQDTAYAYIHPKLQSGNFPNLHVLVETDVERVLFDDNKKAVGVTFRPGLDFQPGTEMDSPRTVRARKQVVVSAGAVGTPQILERSGVGSPEVLARAGVPLVAPIQGVGENYLDHHFIMYPYTNDVGPEETIDGLFSGRVNIQELIPENDPILSWTGVDVQTKLRPSDADVARLGPDFQAAWDKGFKNFPDKPLMIFSVVSCFVGDYSTVPAGQYTTLATFSLHPFSRGRLHITGPKFDDPLDVDPGLLEDENGIDLKMHFWMYKKQREVARRMKTFTGEVATGHPEFPRGSKAAVVDAKVDVSREIEYSPEDDKAIEKWLKEHLIPCWHSMGTCKMAPLEDGGVVDPVLNVYGVQGLKVADLSIPPSNVGCNTCSVALAVGEKAADLIIQELGIAK